MPIEHAVVEPYRLDATKSFDNQHCPCALSYSIFCNPKYMKLFL